MAGHPVNRKSGLISTVHKLFGTYQAHELLRHLSSLGERLVSISETRAAEVEDEKMKLRAPLFRAPSSLDLYPPRHDLFDFSDGKIVIFGLQKAGNTWLLALISDIFEISPYFNVHDPRQFEGRGVVSTHDPLSKTIAARSDFIHGVCLVRDLRDIVVSYFHYMQTESFQSDVPAAKYADIQTFYYDWFLSRMVAAHAYHTYWDDYASHGVPVLRYERLVADPFHELVRLFERWGQPFDVERVKSAIERNSFEKLKQQGRMIGTTAIGSSHFRRGKAGSYKDELPKAILDDINQRFGPTLLRWGYPIE